jgi:hypothetical protein
VATVVVISPEERDRGGAVALCPIENAPASPVFQQTAIWDNNEGPKNIFHFIFILSHVVFCRE